MCEAEEILKVDTILDSCVVAEGKRWYQVKWKSTWMSEEKLPGGILESYKKEKEEHDENDGMFYISEDRKDEDDVVEYLLCRGNTWEAEEKLDSIDKNIVYSYWSSQNELKEIVKIEEEDYESYDSRNNSEGIMETNPDELCLNESGGSIHEPYDVLVFKSQRISMALDNHDYERPTFVKSEVDGDEIVNDKQTIEGRLHDTLNMENRNDYQCSKCNSLFITGKMLDFHSTSELPKGYTKCKKCGEMFCPRCSLNMGELRHHGKKSLFCDRCIDDFSSQPCVENHKVKNNQQKSLKYHNKNVYQNMYQHDGRKPFSCEICGKALSNKVHVKDHEFIVTGENSFQCGDCYKNVSRLPPVNNYEMRTNNMFQYFVPVVFQPIMMDDRDKQVNGIKNAGGQHLTKANMKVVSGAQRSQQTPQKIHHENNTICSKPEDCDQQLLTGYDEKMPLPSNDNSIDYFEEDAINIHQDAEEDVKEAAVSSPGNYKCYDCGRSFNRQYTLDTHQRIHTGEKPYVCEVCGARFRQSGTKLNHVRAVHTKERPFECQYCGKTFSHKSSITVHIRIHTNEKPYKCKTCERCFTDRATYLKHQSIHSGLKPYSCPMCTRRFSQKSNLKRHYKNIHEIPKSNPFNELQGGTESVPVVIAMSEIKDMSEVPPMSQIVTLSEIATMAEITALPDATALPEATALTEATSMPETTPVSSV